MRGFYLTLGRQWSKLVVHKLNHWTPNMLLPSLMNQMTDIPTLSQYHDRLCHNVKNTDNAEIEYPLFESRIHGDILESVQSMVEFRYKMKSISVYEDVVRHNTEIDPRTGNASVPVSELIDSIIEFLQHPTFRATHDSNEIIELPAEPVWVSGYLYVQKIIGHGNTLSIKFDHRIGKKGFAFRVDENGVGTVNPTPTTKKHTPLVQEWLDKAVQYHKELSKYLSEIDYMGTLVREVTKCLNNEYGKDGVRRGCDYVRFVIRDHNMMRAANYIERYYNTKHLVNTVAAIPVDYEFAIQAKVLDATKLEPYIVKIQDLPEQTQYDFCMSSSGSLMCDNNHVPNDVFGIIPSEVLSTLGSTKVVFLPLAIGKYIDSMYAFRIDGKYYDPFMIMGLFDVVTRGDIMHHFKRTMDINLRDCNFEYELIGSMPVKNVPEVQENA